MTREHKNLAFAIAFLLGCFVAIQFCEPNSTWQTIWFVALLFVAFPVLLLRLFEAAKLWRQSENAIRKILGYSFGSFQALFGLVAMVLGAAMVFWLLYNLLIERQPEFKTSGSIILIPLLILCGWFWVRRAFAKPLPEISEWFFIEFDDTSVFVRANPPKREPWSYQFAWADVRRVCFEDNGLSQSDCLYVWIVGQEQSYMLPTEASGGDEFFLELNRRGLFPDDLMKQATFSTDGGLYCYPALDKDK